MDMLKTQIIDTIRHLFHNLGIDIIRRRHWPFGVDWLRDIRYFNSEIAIETAFDIGANVGNISLKISKAYPHCNIYAFEPVPSTYKMLVERIKDHPKISAFQIAIGNRTGKGLITNIPLSGQNTMLIDEKSCVETMEVQLNRIDDFCSQHNINRINIFKIDTEGYDLNVLYGAERLLKENSIDFIVVECDFLKREGEPHSSFIDIYNYLRDHYFNVVSFYTSGVDDLGWIWGDVLFKHIKGMKPGRISGSPEA